MVVRRRRFDLLIKTTFLKFPDGSLKTDKNIGCLWDFIDVGTFRSKIDLQLKIMGKQLE